MSHFVRFWGTQSTQHATYVCNLPLICLLIYSFPSFHLTPLSLSLPFGSGCLAGKQNRILMSLLSLRAGQETRSKAHSQLEISDATWICMANPGEGWVGKGQRAKGQSSILTGFSGLNCNCATRDWGHHEELWFWSNMHSQQLRIHSIRICYFIPRLDSHYVSTWVSIIHSRVC